MISQTNRYNGMATVSSRFKYPEASRERFAVFVEISTAILKMTLWWRMAGLSHLHKSSARVGRLADGIMDARKLLHRQSIQQYQHVSADSECTGVRTNAAGQSKSSFQTATSLSSLTRFSGLASRMCASVQEGGVNVRRSWLMRANVDDRESQWTGAEKTLVVGVRSLHMVLVSSLGAENSV